MRSVPTKNEEKTETDPSVIYSDCLDVMRQTEPDDTLPEAAATSAQEIHCARCGSGIARRVKSNGKRESSREYAARKFCSTLCSNKYHGKKTQVKHCLQCGTQMSRKIRPSGSIEGHTDFANRIFCGQACMGEYAAPGGAKRVCRENNSRRKARGLVKRVKCEACHAVGVPLHVHHVDKNPLNNELSNLQVLCIPCHAKADRESRPIRECRICGERSIALSLCSRHYQRFKKHGDPTMKILRRNHPPEKVQI